MPITSPPSGLTEFTETVGQTDWGGWMSPGRENPRPKALLLHGTGGNRETWQPLIHALGPQTRHWGLVIPDLPGHGKTRCGQHRQHGLKEMAHDLHLLLSSMEIDRVDLVVGHSAGAAVGIWLSLLNADTGAPFSIGHIIGVAPSLVPPPSLYNLLLGPLLNPLFVSGLSVSAITMLARNTRMVDRLIQSTGSKIPQSQLEAYRQLFREEQHVRGAIEFMAGTDLPALLQRGPALSASLDLLIAEDDPWIPAQALRRIAADHFPKAKLHFCQGGHLVHEADPRPLASLMIQSLN